MTVGQSVGSDDLKKAFKNTLEKDVKQYGDFLALGKVFETMDERAAAAECYLAFARNVLEYEKKQDGVDRVAILSFYGVSLGDMELNSFAGPVEFVLGAYYLSFLHKAFVTDIIAGKVRYEKRAPRNFGFNTRTSAAAFLNWVKNTHGNRTLPSIAAFERCVREIAASGSYQFVSNIRPEEICYKWRTAFTDAVPQDREAEFIFAL